MKEKCVELIKRGQEMRERNSLETHLNEINEDFEVNRKKKQEATRKTKKEKTRNHEFHHVTKHIGRGVKRILKNGMKKIRIAMSTYGKRKAIEEEIIKHNKKTLR